MKQFDHVEAICLLEQITTFLSDTQRRNYGTGVTYTPVEVHTITNIGKTPGITISELANAMGKTIGAASQILKKLENNGLIYRVSDEKDAKKKHLRLTPEGEKLDQAHIAYDTQNGAPWCEYIMQDSSQLEREYVLNVLAQWFERMKQYRQQ